MLGNYSEDYRNRFKSAENARNVGLVPVVTKDKGRLSKDRGRLSKDRGRLSKDRGRLSKDRGRLSKDRGRLSKSVIDRIIAERDKMDDEAEAERVDAKDALESYAYSLKNTLSDSKVDEKLDAKDKSKLKAEIDNTVA
jgi:molecular chaperone DnaK (HSP70)